MDIKQPKHQQKMILIIKNNNIYNDDGCNDNTINKKVIINHHINK